MIEKEKEKLTSEEVESMYEAINKTKEALLLKQQKRHSADFNAALAYLNHFHEAGLLYGVRGIQTQLLYILGNTKNWRGETARECKRVFNNIVKKL